MKITKILVALSFLFAVSTAHAGELTVTGSMETTYSTETDVTTGNPLGMDRELKFAGSTELDNGITVSVMQDTTDAFALGNSQISFGNVAGLATIYVGSDHDPMDAIDDITPSAYEEANGSGSGTYTSNDIGDNAGETGIGVKFSLPILGAVNYKFYPKLDGAENADNANSSDTNHNVGSGSSLTITSNLADLPVAGAFLDGFTLTAGYEEMENSLTASTDDQDGATAALTYANGPLKFGFQKKYHFEGQATAAAAATTSEEAEYVDTIVGIAYAVNDNLSLSFNRYESKRSTAIHSNGGEVQETDAINVGYTIGGMTIGFQEAQTDGDAYAANSSDDTRTVGISVAF